MIALADDCTSLLSPSSTLLTPIWCIFGGQQSHSATNKKKKCCEEELTKGFNMKNPKIEKIL
ncbi:hypothetical protein KFK09_003023 [Dendrobium nobile]|uniref:Uncharacterized protein n=1 Tax=Dendrobium nobile TaxID=94219 RepID=A0A8T3C8W9_DENNO|nr:hypothetical protein KFK09_003023 [Dendrobium nobile]